MDDKYIDNMFTMTDQFGNEILCRRRKLFLKLIKEKRQRQIGKIVPKDGILYYSKFEKEKDIFRKLNAWSICYAVLEKVDRVTFYTDKKIYRITCKEIEDNKVFLHFKKSGIERKIYVPLDMWKIEDRVVTEKQERLFNES